MLVLCEDLEGVQWCRFRGNLDVSTAPEFRQDAATLCGQPRVLFDLSEVGFIDSCGLGALIGAIRRVRDAGGDAVVCSIRAPIIRLLRSVGLEAIVRLSPSVGEALDVFRHPAAA
jgi:anti-sigma B factor antagonist